MAGNPQKKSTGIVNAAIGALAVVLAILIVWMMNLVSGIQGTARIINYAGLVRGKTQRIVKLEISGQPQDGMIADIDALIAGLRFGSDKLSLVRLNDDAFQSKMQELDDYFQALKQEIGRVRAVGSNNTDIIPISETFFGICDDATGLAEAYSQRKATSLSALEKYITADIVVLMLLIGYQLFQALHTAAMNRALQHKVYLDAATGLPNKNKCEELLDDPTPPAPETGMCSFDLNNLRRINNSMGHEAGDAYIRRFAVALRAAMKCMLDGKQVAILVPTTVLAQQHYLTAMRRFATFPVTIDVLSRFRTPAQIKKTLFDLQSGKIDLIVGTHKLLQKDIHFHDLGLLIVDEEQRFGVTHKERLKELSRGVDVLTLSATPIPRTLRRRTAILCRRLCLSTRTAFSTRRSGVNLPAAGRSIISTTVWNPSTSARPKSNSASPRRRSLSRTAK